MEELDDASSGAIQRLLAAADDLIARSDPALSQLAKELRDNVSAVAQAPAAPGTASRGRPIGPTGANPAS